MTDVLLVHHAELGIKKGKRSSLERRLTREIQERLGSELIRRPRVVEGRIVAEISPEADRTSIVRRLNSVFGVAWFALACRCDASVAEIEKIVERVVATAVDARPGTFKASVRRADKKFPFSSPEFAARIGKRIVEGFGLVVDLEQPDLVVHVEIISNAAFVFTERHEGLRGMPGASSGRLICLFSGGIDSPVAAWMMTRRGAVVDLLHFHPFSRADELRQTKIFELYDCLKQYCPRMKHFLVPHYHFEVPASVQVPPSLEMVIFRRFIFRTAVELAWRRKYHGLVSGDCLGQVASQTIENLEAVQSDLGVPLFHPIIAFDKDEVVRHAREIGTFDLSVREYKDCCSLMARRPRTRVSAATVRRLEEKLGMDRVIKESLESLEIWNGSSLSALK